MRLRIAARLGGVLLLLAGLAAASAWGANPQAAPTITFSTFIGGSNNDYAQAVAIDAQGNTYATGYTISNDFPVSTGAYQSGGFSPAPISKIGPDGALVFTALLGTNDEGSVDGRAIAVDGVGNIYVAGNTDSPNFPATPGAYDTSYNGKTDIFVAKLDPTGARLLYATYIGTENDDYGYSIAVDAQGRAVIGGSSGLSADAIIVRLNADGSALDYARRFNGSFEDRVSALAVDSSGAVYAAGSTRSDDFFTTPNAYDRVHDDGSLTVLDWDAFALKLDANGQPVFSSFLGAVGNDFGMAIAVDGAGSPIVVGSTGSAGSAMPPLAPFPTTADAPQRSYGGGISDVFITKFSSDGAALRFSTLLGGNRKDEGNAVALDAAGNVFLAGRSDSPQFPLKDPLEGQVGMHEVCTMGFVAALDSQGRNLFFSSYIGGANQIVGAGCGDVANGIAVGSDGTLHIVGSSTADDFPLVAPIQTYQNAADAFVTRLRLTPPGGGVTPRVFVYVPLVTR